MKAYAPRPNSPPPADVEHISAVEYLAADAKAARNGFDKPAFKHINNELKKLPMTRLRLAFEMLPLAWQSLERGEEPLDEIGFAGCSWSSIEPQRLSEYSTWFEKIILRSFELRDQLSNPPGEHGPFAMTLLLSLTTLGRVDRNRFLVMLEILKRRGGDANLDTRWKVISRAEKIIMKQEGDES
jgi:hypothetical protein